MIDLRLVAAQAARGDHAAFRRIVDSTKDGMFRLACRLLGNASAAEDALQDAYIKVYQALIAGGFSGEAKLETWMYRIVTNTCLDALRRRTRVAPPALDEEPHASVSTEARLALGELEKWLGELPDEQRAVVVLRCVEGLSTAETAQALDVSEGAVEQRLVRARATLRGRNE
jgi:RNA polymerase sigma-70 factor, ECF subfamily